MSSSLHVKLVRMVEIAELISAISTNLQDLLDIKTCPPIRIFKMEKENLYPVESNLIDSEQVLAVKISDEQETVQIIIMELLEEEMLPAEESDFWVSIIVGAMRTPLEFALAASTAIALARLVSTSIIDDGMRWGAELQQMPADFANQLRIRGPFIDLQEAATVFYSNMMRNRRIKT